MPDVQKRLVGLGGEPGNADAGPSSRRWSKSDYDRFGQLDQGRQRQARAMKPTIALFTGDPAGIGPELVAKLLADGAAQRASGHPADRRRVRWSRTGMRAAGVQFDSSAVTARARPRRRARRLAARRGDADSSAARSRRRTARTCWPAWRSASTCAARGDRRRDVLRAAQQGRAARRRHAARRRAALFLRSAGLPRHRASSSTCSNRCGRRA